MNEEIETIYYPLRPMQRWLIETNLHKLKSNMMNLSVWVKFEPSIDLQKLADAVNAVLNAHDVFRCRFVKNPATNEICQRFNGEIPLITVQKISDEEFQERVKKLDEPYNFINHQLWIIKIFETPTAKYGYANFYHAIMDGTSFSLLFWREVGIRYEGKKINRIPMKYADYVLEELKISPADLEEGHKYWLNLLKDFNAKKHLLPPDIQAERKWQKGNFEYQVKNISREFFSDKNFNETVFFLAASMIAIAKTAGAESSILSWVHNGRTSAQELRLMGLLIEQIPIAWDFTKDCSVENFFAGLEEKINEGLKYRKSLDVVYNKGLEDNLITFIFQKSIFGLGNGYNIAGTTVEVLDIPDDEYSAVENVLDIEVNLCVDDNYIISFDYDISTYTETTIKNFAAQIDATILQLQNQTQLVSKIFKRKI
ncbi:MAG: hypothetical protein IJQ16_06470 [Selenomonadaceae bacterium]|nr:hypothetical protein [Selenomonadaceae bacterium]